MANTQDHKRTDKGQPSATNKSEGTGTPADVFKPGAEKDDTLTNMHTDDDETISRNTRTNNENRNVSKGDATNAGGYKN